MGPNPHRKSETINVGCFKLLNFGVICYRAIDNKYTFPSPLSLSPLTQLYFSLQHQLLLVYLAHPQSPAQSLARVDVQLSINREGMQDTQWDRSRGLRRGEATGNPAAPGLLPIFAGAGGSGLPPLQKDAGQGPRFGLLRLCGRVSSSFMPLFLTIPFGFPLPSGPQAYFSLFGLEIC